MPPCHITRIGRQSPLAAPRAGLKEVCVAIRSDRSQKVTQSQFLLLWILRRFLADDRGPAGPM